MYSLNYTSVCTAEIWFHCPAKKKGHALFLLLLSAVLTLCLEGACLLSNTKKRPLSTSKPNILWCTTSPSLCDYWVTFGIGARGKEKECRARASGFAPLKKKKKKGRRPRLVLRARSHCHSGLGLDWARLTRWQRRWSFPGQETGIAGQMKYHVIFEGQCTRLLCVW